MRAARASSIVRACSVQSERRASRRSGAFLVSMPHYTLCGRMRQEKRIEYRSKGLRNVGSNPPRWIQSRRVAISSLRSLGSSVSRMRLRVACGSIVPQYTALQWKCKRKSEKRFRLTRAARRVHCRFSTSRMRNTVSLAGDCHIGRPMPIWQGRSTPGEGAGYAIPIKGEFCHSCNFASLRLQHEKAGPLACTSSPAEGRKQQRRLFG